MRILIFNLRDIRNPKSGGAEIFTHQIAKRWVSWGNEVTIVASNFQGGKRYETIDGINIIRLGNIFTVFQKTRKIYELQFRGKFDIIIDEYTLRPFMTPKYVKENIIFLVHELAREKFFYELPPLISHIYFYYLEPSWLKKYCNLNTVTVSNSTKKDLLQFGFNKIDIVTEGIAFRPLQCIPKKDEETTILYVGLLKKSNLVNHAIEAFKIVQKSLPNARLWVVGRGSERRKLDKIACGTRNITFFGYVSEEKKLELMRRATMLIVPAIREGWGLVVTEANACGTPAIGYDVPGLRDSIKNGETGLLSERNPKSLASEIYRVATDHNLRERLTRNALKYSHNFSWDTTSYEFLRIIERIFT